jgi:hypothetical protein
VWAIARVPFVAPPGDERVQRRLAVIAAVSGPDFDMPRRYIRFVCRVPAGQATVTCTVW